MTDTTSSNLLMTSGAVNTGNLKAIGDTGSLTASQSSQQQQQNNSLSAQNALANQQVAQAIVTQSLQAHTAVMNALSARASGFILDSSEITKGLADQGATLAAIQEDLKAAQTAAPQTGTGGAFGSDAGSALLQQIVNSQTVIAASLDAIAAKLAQLKTA